MSKTLGKVRFAIVGCGRIAQRHAKHINNLAKLTAACDIKLRRAEKLGREYNVPIFQHIDDMLKMKKLFDVVSVCTPNWLHAEHTIKSLESGKHVICEKPMATSVDDCKNMIYAAEKANKLLFIVKQNRFNPPIVALKNAIDQGKLGNIINVHLNCFWNRNDDYYLQSDWKGKLCMDGGTLFTQFSHFIDLLYWMVGDIKSVYAMTNNFNHQETIEFEDTGVVILKFESGSLGSINFTINSYQKNMEGSITIFGEKGTVKIGGQYLNVLEYQSIKDYKIENIPESSPANDYGFYQGSMSNHDKIYENVLQVLNGDGVIATNGIDGMKTVNIIENIYKSVEALKNR